MQILDSRTVRILTTICVFIAVGAFLYGVRQTIVVFLFAIFFAYLLDPVVTRVQSSSVSRHSRGIAIAETYLLLGIVLGALGYLFGPKLVEDTRALAQNLPNLLENVTSGKIIWQLGRKHAWSYETQLHIEHLISSHRAQILSWITQAGTQAAHVLANAVWVALIPILSVFFLADGRTFAHDLICMVERRDRRRLLRGIIDDLDQMLARFIFSQLVLGALSLVAYCSFLMLMRFPYALPLGLAGGAMEFIPVVGPLVAAVAILGVGFLAGYGPLWAVLIFFGVWRLCTDYVISPHIYGKGLKLHPLAAIAAVLMGGELGGILGVYLAIPIAAAIRIVWHRAQDFPQAVDDNRPEAALRSA